MHEAQFFTFINTRYPFDPETTHYRSKSGLKYFTPTVASGSDSVGGADIQLLRHSFLGKFHVINRRDHSNVTQLLQLQRLCTVYSYSRISAGTAGAGVC